MNNKTTEEMVAKRPDAKLAECFGGRPRMAHGEMEVANCDHLMKRILNVRGKMIMVDRDIADLYKVPTKVLNQAVKRNIERFPDRFRFCLTAEEKNGVVTICDHLAVRSRALSNRQSPRSLSSTRMRTQRSLMCFRRRHPA